LQQITLEALKMGHTVLPAKNTCLYLVSVLQTAPPLIVVADI